MRTSKPLSRSSIRPGVALSLDLNIKARRLGSFELYIEYGTKSAGADFRNHLRDCMDLLGFTSCLADPDLWMRKAMSNKGIEYYEYVLLYIDVRTREGY